MKGRAENQKSRSFLWNKSGPKDKKFKKEMKTEKKREIEWTEKKECN